MMKDSQLLVCALLATVLLLAPHHAREIGPGEKQQPSSQGDSSLSVATAEATQAADVLQQPAARQQKSSDVSMSRRLGPDAAAAAGSSTQDLSQELHLPEVNTAKFRKLATNVSRPLGTALNGSAWIPGACGNHPSALGYQCSWVAPEGAVLHWTYSPHSSSPPINRCTVQPEALPNLEISELDGPTIHFALQAATKERMHLAFVDPQARIYPSEGVHGRAVDPCTKPAACNSTSTPQVEVLHHVSTGVAWVTGRISSMNPELIQGWAGWVSADAGGQTQVICFSRHVHTKQMKLGLQNTKELLLQYAVGDATNYMAYGKQHGMLALDPLTGKVSEIERPTRVLLAHAILMLIAFGVLLPSGLLLARHKWLFMDAEQGLSPLWALSHFGLLALCAMVGLAGMIVALVRFGNTICGLVMSTHQVLGLMSVGLSVVLVVMYGLRPFLVSGHKRGMPSPLLGPQKVVGVVTIAAGWASLFLGCVTIHQNWAAPYINWLLPCILLTALVAGAAALLELRYQKLVRTGLYNPKTCTMTNAGPSMPLVHIRTHREPTVLSKKQEPGGSTPCDLQLDDGGHVIAAHHGDSSAVTCNVAAAILARSIGAEGVPVSRSAISTPGGRGSSSAGGAVRRARHSTPNAAQAVLAAQQVQTGFPSSPGAHPTDA